MNALYFDTTYLCKLRWPEVGSVEVAALADTADQLVTAFHGRAEFHSVGHRKLREGIATAQAIRVVNAQFQADCKYGDIRLLPLTDGILDRVADVFGSASADLYLRAADALHLATAAEYGFKRIYSNDRHLLAAASLFGIQGVNVIP